VDRLVAEAIARFMPETADAARTAAADRRHFTIEHGRVSFDGTSCVHGELDLADALDLEAAVAHGAATLAALGCTDTLDVRRAAAAGDLARRQLALDLTDPTPAGDPTDDHPAAGATGAQARGRGRQVVLYVHLSEAAVFDDGVETELARVENTGALGTMVTADTIRDWCGRPDARVVVKPVIDLHERVATGAYEIPDRLAEQVALRDVSCSFPFCQRRARRCDTDHVIAYARGGETATENLAALCRRHPPQDPRRLDLHGPRTRVLSVAKSARAPVPTRPHRHPRRHPTRHAPGLLDTRPNPAGPLDRRATDARSAPATWVRATPLKVSTGRAKLRRHIRAAGGQGCATGGPAGIPDRRAPAAAGAHREQRVR